jgi:hypothetical protein
MCELQQRIFPAETSIEQNRSLGNIAKTRQQAYIQAENGIRNSMMEDAEIENRALRKHEFATTAINGTKSNPRWLLNLAREGATGEFVDRGSLFKKWSSPLSRSGAETAFKSQKGPVGEHQEQMLKFSLMASIEWLAFDLSIQSERYYVL